MTFCRITLPHLVAALASALALGNASAQAPSDKPTVSGKFLGDGKDAKIQFLVAQPREAFSDKPAIRLVFTEKNPSASKKPDFDAAFKKLGSALILSVDREGGIFGCEVAHTAHEKSPFSALGEIKMQDFKVTDTHVSGHVVTGGELDAFGQKWEVDLTFSSPLPKGAFAAAASEPAADEPKKMAKTEEAPPADAGPKIPIADLPLPSSARDIEYKAIVEQIAFNADSSVSTVATDFSSKLKAKGWKETPGSLIGKTNAILKRRLDGADLTIMVQPAGKGSTVKVFAEGLDWSNPPASTASAAPQPGKTPDVKSIEAEANRLINDALKQIPSFK